MIAVDTNILVRYAVRDEPSQTLIVTQFLANHRCFILKTVLLELVWVLESDSGYTLPRSVVLKRVKHLLGLATVVVEDAGQIAVALQYYEAGMDFADALHLVSSLELEGFATFDKRIAKKATLLNISHKVILISLSQVGTDNEGTV